MTKRWSPPPKGEAGSGVVIEAAKLDAPDYADDYDDTQAFVTLGDAAHMALTSLWWRMRRDGVELPAELGGHLNSWGPAMKPSNPAYKATVAVKGSRVPFTQKRTAADFKYIAWLQQKGADEAAGRVKLPEVVL